jgi:hypothetical protein
MQGPTEETRVCTNGVRGTLLWPDSCARDPTNVQVVLFEVEGCLSVEGVFVDVELEEN